MWKNKPFSFAVSGILALTVGSAVLYGVQSFNAGKSIKETVPSLSPTTHTLVARLEIFADPVEVRLPGKNDYDSAKENMIIPEGAIIRTGESGRAQIVFPEGTVTRVDFDSIIRLKNFDPKPQNIYIEILQGRIWSRIKKLFGNETYQSSGGTMVASVRGTSYGHGLLPNDVNRGSVLKGTVEMECIDGSNEATLYENMLAEVNCTTGKGFAEEVNQINTEDEWVQFNMEQDDVLDDRFGEETYGEDDVLGLTSDSEPGPSVTLNPTGLRGTNTPRPTSSPRPTPSVKSRTPTPVPTSVASTGATNTPVQKSSTPTLTPTPIQRPPSIIRATESPSLISGLFGYSAVLVAGTNFQNGTLTVQADQRTFSPDGYFEKTDTVLSAKFKDVPCGTVIVTVTTPGGSVSQSVEVVELCLQIPLLR